MIAAAARGYDLTKDFSTNGPVHEALYVIAGLIVFIAFIFAARFVAHLVGQWLLKRQVRPDMIVLGRRAATAIILLLVGDHIAIDAHTGVIVEVKLRVTMLKSDEGNLIVIPNSDLFTKAVTIYNASVEARTAPPT